MTSRIRVGRDDLPASRFAISQVWELIGVVRQLHRNALRRWLERPQDRVPCTRPRGEFELVRTVLLSPGRGADFICPVSRLWGSFISKVRLSL